MNQDERRTSKLLGEPTDFAKFLEWRKTQTMIHNAFPKPAELAKEYHAWKGD